ncbi:YrzI family small protein [Bacillus sp. CGMCC 1.16607]
MTLNILFFTLTIKKRKMTAKDYLHEESIYKMIEENRNHQMNIQRLY